MFPVCLLFLPGWRTVAHEAPFRTTLLRDGLLRSRSRRFPGIARTWAARETPLPYPQSPSQDRRSNFGHRTRPAESATTKWPVAPDPRSAHIAGDGARFCQWCGEHDSPTLPINPAPSVVSLSTFAVRGVAPPSIARALAAIVHHHHHRYAGLATPHRVERDDAVIGDVQTCIIRSARLQTQPSTPTLPYSCSELVRRHLALEDKDKRVTIRVSKGAIVAGPRPPAHPPSPPAHLSRSGRHRGWAPCLGHSGRVARRPGSYRASIRWLPNLY